MLHFHYTSIVESFLLHFAFPQYAFEILLLLTLTVSVRDLHVEKRILAFPPESSCSDIKSNIVLQFCCRFVAPLVNNWLEMRFTFYIMDKGQFQQLTFYISDSVMTFVDEFVTCKISILSQCQEPIEN